MSGDNATQAAPRADGRHSAPGLTAPFGSAWWAFGGWGTTVGDMTTSSGRPDLLGGPPATLLPTDPAAAALAAGQTATQAAARFPASSTAWATLAEQALDGARPVEAYAYARTGYHRGLDALRRAGWRGHGPVPWSHEPNQGFLRALAALGRAADAIGETAEVERITTFLLDSDPDAREHLGPLAP